MKHLFGLVQHPASLPRHLVTLKSLTSSLAVDAYSAGLRERAPARAVELLEQGRRIFWSQLTRLRSPLDDLIGSGPGRKEVGGRAHAAGLAHSQCSQFTCCRSARTSQPRTVTDIRKLLGLSRFLLPLQIPQEEVRELSKELYTLTVSADKDDVTKNLVSFLRELWD